MEDYDNEYDTDGYIPPIRVDDVSDTDEEFLQHVNDLASNLDHLLTDRDEEFLHNLF